MKVVAVSGWKRSGKDTIADYLVQKYEAKRIAFADPLKEMVSELFGLSLDTINNPATKEAPLLDLPVEMKDKFSTNNNRFLWGEFRDQNGKRYGEGSPESVMCWTPRALCIMLGSSMRCIDPNFWVKKAIQQTKPGQLYVISDLRYRNEIESLKKEVSNVKAIRINRFDTCESTDPSERDLDNYQFDALIENKGTIADLYFAVDRELAR